MFASCFVSLQDQELQSNRGDLGSSGIVGVDHDFSVSFHSSLSFKPPLPLLLLSEPKLWPKPFSGSSSAHSWTRWTKG